MEEKDVTEKLEINDGMVTENDVLESKEETDEEPKPLGHKATGIWYEDDGIRRMREIPNRVFHKDPDVAERMAKNYMEDYAEDQGKNIKNLRIELEPVFD